MKPNNLGLVGAICNVEVSGETRRAMLRACAAEVMREPEEVQRLIIEAQLRGALQCDTLRLLSHEWRQLDDAPSPFEDPRANRRATLVRIERQ